MAPVAVGPGTCGGGCVRKAAAERRGRNERLRGGGGDEVSAAHPSGRLPGGPVDPGRRRRLLKTPSSRALRAPLALPGSAWARLGFAGRDRNQPLPLPPFITSPFRHCVSAWVSVTTD